MTYEQGRCGWVEGICCNAAIRLYSMSLLQSESIHLTPSFGIGLRHWHASASMLRRSNLEFESERVNDCCQGVFNASWTTDSGL
jgi:hypothetical protein